MLVEPTAAETRPLGWSRRTNAATWAVALALVACAACGGGRARPAALDTQCKAGSAGACVRLGAALEDGGDDLPNPGRASRFYAMGCAHEGPEAADACWRLARILRDGDGVKADAKKARALAQEACTGGQPMGCLLLATMELRGEGGPVATAKAVARFQALCRGGLARACNDLGVAQRGTDAAAAEATFRRACAKGNALACANVGVIEAKRGDYGAALPRLQRACDAKVPSACVQLAVCASRGQGRAKDASAAGIYYQRACKLGDANGCSGLALLLFVGAPGVPARPREAMHLWRSLCESGHAAACFNLATGYRVGAKGALKPRPEAARAWFARACELGVKQACSAAESPARPSGPDQHSAGARDDGR